jgi:hypothetical protein
MSQENVEVVPEVFEAFTAVSKPGRKAAHEHEAR